MPETVPSWSFEILLVIGMLLATAVLFDVLQQRRHPAATLAWMLALYALPLLGVLLYLLIGARKLPRPRARMQRLNLGPALVVDEDDATEADRFLRALGVPGATRGNRFDLQETPDAAGRALYAAISAARHYVLVDLYTLARDGVGKAFLELLTAKAREGVAVALLVDDVGSRFTHWDGIQALQEAGGRIARFSPLLFGLNLRRFNLRNHRKIIVMDGERAWTGGRNVGDVYLGNARCHATWIDLSCLVEGPCLKPLEDIVRSDWLQATGQALDIERREPQPVAVSDERIQVLPSGPDLREDYLHAHLLERAFRAERRIWLVSPYFVPDEALQLALVLAARRGIDLRVLVPERSDNILVDAVRMGYLRELQAVGARVFRYQGRMLHSKAWLIDDRLAAMGSANLDGRSLFLNHEIMLLLHSRDSIATVGAHLAGLFQKAREGVPAAGPVRETLAGALRIFAPML